MYIINGFHVKSIRADMSMSTNDHEEADSRIFHDLVQHHSGAQLRSDLAHESTSTTTIYIQSANNVGEEKAHVFSGCELTRSVQP